MTFPSPKSDLICEWTNRFVSYQLPATIFPICFPTILRIVFSFVTASLFFIFNTADLRIDCSPLRRYLPGQFFTPLPRALFSKKIISQRIRIYSPRIANTFTRSVQWKHDLWMCFYSWRHEFLFHRSGSSLSNFAPISCQEFRNRWLSRWSVRECHWHRECQPTTCRNKRPEPNYCRRRLLLLILQLFCLSEMSTGDRVLCIWFRFVRNF